MGLSHTTVTAALTVGLIVSALMGPSVGCLLDRHGPQLIMGAGTAIGVLALGLVAIAPNLLVFFAAWILAGFAQAATLYPPAFAVITRWYGAERTKPLTTTTLVGGLARRSSRRSSPGSSTASAGGEPTVCSPDCSLSWHCRCTCSSSTAPGPTRRPHRR
ncbi:MAG: MFS transporter [Brevibacterium sp.]|uniref:MFS transporter n=1 Tax=Brevibacterium TaxID=1696 RepID=UPI003F8CD2A1